MWTAHLSFTSSQVPLFLFIVTPVHGLHLPVLDIERLRYSTHTWFENYVHLEILQIQALFGNGKILTATDIQKKT